MKKKFSPSEIDRIIQMAWEDRTPFEAIDYQFGIKQCEVIALMRRALKPTSFKLWRARTRGQKTKHLALRSEEVDRFSSSRQRSISRNKISKRK